MSGRLTVGLVLIALGVVFLLGALDVVAVGAVLASWWPLALVALGALQALEQRRLGSGPLIVMAVGVLLLAATTDLVAVTVGMIWPLALIAAGVWLLVRRGPSRADVSDDARLEATALIGDRHLRSGSRHFQGAAVTSLFGDVDLDLRDVELAGDGAAVDLTVIFGDVSVTAPADSKVVVSASSLFGDIDQRGAPEPAADDAPTLAVRGFVVFGDVEIRR